VKESLKRISLSMKSAEHPRKPAGRDKKAHPPAEKKTASIQDLMAKFNRAR
jgi:predicted RNA-binding protein with RPS1 domain